MKLELVQCWTVNHSRDWEELAGEWIYFNENDEKRVRINRDIESERDAYEVSIEEAKALHAELTELFKILDEK